MSRKLLPFLFAFLLLGAAVGCSSSEDDAGDDEGTTTTAEDSGSEDEGGDEGEEEGEDEGDDGETDKAEAALEEITKNFGITKKDPDSSSDDGDDPSEDEGDDGETDTGFDDSGLSADEEDCLLEALLENPDLLDIAENAETATVEEQAELLDVLFACVDPSVLGDAFAEGIAESVPGLTADEATCLGEGFTALDPDVIADLLLINADPTYTPGMETQEALMDLFTNCGIDPTAL